MRGQGALGWGSLRCEVANIASGDEDVVVQEHENVACGGKGIGVAEGIWIERIGKGRLLGGN